MRKEIVALIRSSKYRKMTTDEIEELERKLSHEADMMCEERKELSKEISSYRYKCAYLRGIVARRRKSPYNGEYYIKSDFRKKYGKPFSEMNAHERRKYMLDYYNDNREILLEKKKDWYRAKKKNK